MRNRVHRCMLWLPLGLAACCCSRTDCPSPQPGCSRPDAAVSVAAAAYDNWILNLRSGSSQSERAIQSLLAAGPSAVPALTGAARRSTDTLQLIRIVNILGSIGHAATPSIPTLERIAARDHDSHLSAAAAAAIASIRSEPRKDPTPSSDWEEWSRKNKVQWDNPR